MIRSGPLPFLGNPRCQRFFPAPHCRLSPPNTVVGTRVESSNVLPSFPEKHVAPGSAAQKSFEGLAFRLNRPLRILTHPALPPSLPTSDPQVFLWCEEPRLFRREDSGVFGRRSPFPRERLRINPSFRQVGRLMSMRIFARFLKLVLPYLEGPRLLKVLNAPECRLVGAITLRVTEVAPILRIYQQPLFCVLPPPRRPDSCSLCSLPPP